MILNSATDTAFENSQKMSVTNVYDICVVFFLNVEWPVLLFQRRQRGPFGNRFHYA